MKLLLDTHVVLWWVDEYEKLSSSAKAMLQSDEHTLSISIVSMWEIAIKVSLGKLRGHDGGVRTFLAKMEELPICLIPLMPRHVEIVETLPFIHRDPFDRLLVAAAKADSMTILTADENIRKYDVPSVW